MTPEESQQIILNILDRAEKGESTEAHPIKSWNEYRYYCQEAKVTKAIIKMLQESIDNVTKSYCKDIISGTADLEMLFAFTQVNRVLDFYKVERNILNCMLTEYENYLRHENFLRIIFFGEERDI